MYKGYSSTNMRMINPWKKSARLTREAEANGHFQNRETINAAKLALMAQSATSGQGGKISKCASFQNTSKREWNEAEGNNESAKEVSFELNHFRL